MGVLLFASVIYYQSRRTLPTATSTAQEITLAAVAQHSTAQNCWIILGQKVYSLTSYNVNHPTDTTYASICGTDATDTLNASTPSATSAALQTKLQPYFIGVVVP